MKQKNFARGSWLFCLLAGALFSLPYFFEYLFWLTIPILAGFFFLLNRFMHGKPFLAFFAFFAGFYIPIYSWLSVLYPMSSFGYTKLQAVLLLIGACVLLPMIHALLAALVMQFSRFLPEGPILRSLGLASLWVLYEWLCTLGTFAFPWGTVALSQTGFGPFLQLTSVFGTYFLVFIIVFISSLLASAFCRKRRLLSFLTACSTCITCLLCGCILLLLPASGDTVSVSVVQGNATTEEKWSTESKLEIYERYLSMTEEAAKENVSVIVLPESAIAANFTEGGPLHDSFAEIATRYNCTIIMGILRTDERGTHNSIVSIQPDGSVSNIYDKQHLVPFGEFLPMKSLLEKIAPSLGEINLGGFSIVSDETPSIIDTGKYKVGCAVCYDSVFPSPKENVGSDFAVILSNDSWFEDSPALAQHFRFSKLRAVETGSPVISATNTGISGIIDSKGKVTAQSNALQQEILRSSVTLSESVTPYKYFKNLMIWISAILLLPMFFFGFIHNKIHSILHRRKKS